MAISVGFPTLIPMVIMLVFNLLSTFMNSSQSHTSNYNQSTQYNSNSRSNIGFQRDPRPTTTSSEESNYYGPMVLVFLMISIGLQILIKKIMRN